MALSGVQRRIGVVDDLVAVRAGSREGRDADRDGERSRAAVVPTERRRQQMVRDDLRALGVTAGEQQRELVAAGAIGAVAAAQVRTHDLGDRPQEVVAGRVALHVVDRLEVVDVDHDERQRLLVVACLPDTRVELLLEGAVVPETRQAVEERIEAGAVIGLAELDEVAADRRDAARDPPSKEKQDRREEQRTARRRWPWRGAPGSPGSHPPGARG